MRKFNSGATRNDVGDKLDYEGFLSPLAIEAYAKYMHKNRHLDTGELRDSDNWQKGIPLPSYMKSMWRHVIMLWSLHRGYRSDVEATEEALCGILFNAFGYLHEVLKEAPVMKENESVNYIPNENETLSDIMREKVRDYETSAVDKGLYGDERLAAIKKEYGINLPELSEAPIG